MRGVSCKLDNNFVGKTTKRHHFCRQIGLIVYILMAFKEELGAAEMERADEFVTFKVDILHSCELRPICHQAIIDPTLPKKISRNGPENRL